jgi:cytochrome P450
MWPLRPGRLHHLAVAAMRRRETLRREALVELIRDRRLESGSHGDALRALLESGLDTRAEQELCEELAALLVVGHETTAAALAWALERLVHEPAVLAQLQASLGDGDSTYLDAFIFEVLRWRPPVVDTVRQLNVPGDVAGCPLPAGTLVMVSPYLVHRRVYDSSDTFRPDRFLGRAVPESRQWVSVGGGSRRCLGAELAVTEMEVVLTELLRVFKPERSDTPGERARLIGTVLVPAQGAMVTLSPVSP